MPFPHSRPRRHPHQHPKRKQPPSPPPMPPPVSAPDAAQPSTTPPTPFLRATSPARGRRQIHAPGGPFVCFDGGFDVVEEVSGQVGGVGLWGKVGFGGGEWGEVFVFWGGGLEEEGEDVLGCAVIWAG